MDLHDVRIETENLVLREIVDEDFDGIHAYASDPEVVTLLSWGPNSEDETRAFMKEAAEEKTSDPRLVYTLAIALSDDTVVGACRLVIPVATERVGKLTYVLNKSYWRRGFMGEAVRGLLEFGFGDLELNRIVGTNPSENWGSGLVLEKVGMVKEGRYDRHILGRDGKWVDATVFAAVRGVWPSKPAAKPPRALERRSKVPDEKKED